MKNDLSQLEETSNRFHHPSKGCKIIKKLFYPSGNDRKSPIVGLECLVHKKDCCKCGWQWGFHFGSNSKKLK